MPAPVSDALDAAAAKRAALAILAESLEGELDWGEATRVFYATDASVYRELPLAVAWPRGAADLRTLVRFAAAHGVALIPRAAGTSLGGQVVGSGLVVDVSKHLTRVLELHVAERWVRVEPGLVRDELNLVLRPHGLMFAPETSTSNRATLGGMVGNNSCGANSLIHGSTRDHLRVAQVVLADGSVAELRALGEAELAEKLAAPTLEGRIYRQLVGRLRDPAVAEELRREFPRPEIRRRNTGYAVDLLLRQQPFAPEGPPLNLCTLLAGAEGTLAFASELTLNLVPVPPAVRGVLAVHLRSVGEAALANLRALHHRPDAVELIDKAILDCAARNPGQAPNRFFLQGDPGALLIVEWARATPAAVEAAASALEASLRAAGLGYAYPRLLGPDVDRVWSLRKAGLGVLANIPGDAKAVACIEDTAVAPGDLPSYLEELAAVLHRHGLPGVFYAHIGDGEVHTRPVLDLKRGEEQAKFHAVTAEVATLVKRYRGSLSGEHGDGRVRGPWLRAMVGPRNYDFLVEVKRTWDPAGVFNPGKIVESPPMNEALRYVADRPTREFATVFDFSPWGGVVRLAEQCNGSGDCRKSHRMGGAMCPSFMATGDEAATPRARANVLREMLTRSAQPNPFAEPAIATAMSTCLACKACRFECPSSVDVALLKAEWLQQCADRSGVPWRRAVFGRYARIARWASLWPALANGLAGSRLASPVLKRLLRVAPARALPRFAPQSFGRWVRRNPDRLSPPPGTPRRGRVHLFVDEFSNFQEPEVAQAFLHFCRTLGYEVILAAGHDSARPLISQGLLREARVVAEHHVAELRSRVTADAPLVGLEPSALLGFRDEFPRLVRADLRADAQALAPHCLLFEEWVAREARAGRIGPEDFGESPVEIRVHGHCHQKSLSSMDAALVALALPRGHRVQAIAAGCCGMAGAFGYEAEHHVLSLAVGELALFPAVRAAAPAARIVAAGTSCRQQIADGTGRRAEHPAVVLAGALRLSGEAVVPQTRN